MQVWWASVLLSEHAANRSYEPLVERARNAKNHRELGDALLELHKYAYEQDDPEHPVHKHLEGILQNHAKHNEKMLNDAFQYLIGSNTARWQDARHTTPHLEHVFGLLMRTPSISAIEHIGKFAEHGNFDAFAAAHGWLARNPHMHHHFATHILPHLNRELSRKSVLANPKHHYLKTIKSDYENIARAIERIHGEASVFTVGSD
jgi:hypothetical protein